MVDIIEALRGYKVAVDVCDPWVDAVEAKREYNLALHEPSDGDYDAVVLAVGHEQFRALSGEGVKAYGKSECVVYDVKNVLPRATVDGRL